MCVGGGRQLAGDSGWRASRIKQLTTALAIGGFSGWPSSDPASLLQLTSLPPLRPVFAASATANEALKHQTRRWRK